MSATSRTCAVPHSKERISKRHVGDNNKDYVNEKVQNEKKVCDGVVTKQRTAAMATTTAIFGFDECCQGMDIFSGLSTEIYSYLFLTYSSFIDSSISHGTVSFWSEIEINIKTKSLYSCQTETFTRENSVR
jgi:hypothetical protein